MNSPFAPARDLLTAAPKFFFFTGKGGVGKTSLACSTAVGLADHGHRVLLVSTDPASNLDEVLGTRLANSPRPISGVPGLQALNIDPAAAAQRYRDKLIEPLRGQLPDAVLRTMEEQLSGACTTEIAAFDEFSRLLGDPAATTDFDHVVFDTAPTGHTLRLLMLPGAWTGFLDTNTSGTSCLGPLAGLEQQRDIYQHAMTTLTDAGATAVVLVSQPQRAALREAARSRDELAALGVTNQRLILNARFHASQPADPIARALEQRGESALAESASFLESLPVFESPLRPASIVGLPALRALFAPTAINPEKISTPPVADPTDPDEGFLPLPVLIDQLAAPGHGVIMTMGKGGVGKTTLAAAIAAELATRGHSVLLTTTDPAAHVVATLDGELPNLTVARIDPAAETAAYVHEVLTTQGAQMDAESRALLAEDLRSPCTEEIAVFRAFARTIARGTDGFVVLDTAPTGHTLLLLDATEAYHRELGRQSRDTTSDEVRQLLPRLRDPDFTRVLLVALPESTPIHEAAALQTDLRRAAIEPFAWIINQSLATTGTSDPLLQQRGLAELPRLREVLAQYAERTARLPWSPTEPTGPEALRSLLTPTNSLQNLKP